MQPFRRLNSIIIPLPHNNVDTDQIIPARYLKVIAKDGLVEGLFADWRYDSTGKQKPDFVFNQTQYKGAQILLTGDNFGCGSSREHAPWVLVGWGIRAVISTSFADIFRNNALMNSLLPVQVDAETHQSLFDLVEEVPGARVTIDLEDQTLTLPDGSTVSFPVDSFAKNCLLEGVDELEYILSFEEQIAAYEANM